MEYTATNKNIFRFFVSCLDQIFVSSCSVIDSVLFPLCLLVKCTHTDDNLCPSLSFFVFR
jgi:hypothetical protein